MRTSWYASVVSSVVVVAVIATAVPAGAAPPPVVAGNAAEIAAAAREPGSADGAPWNAPWTPPDAADDGAAAPAEPPTTSWAAPAEEPRAAQRRSTGTTVQRAPAGTTAAAPGVGALPWFAFDETEISLDLVARVNLANGNLLLTASDGVLNGVGPAVRSDRFYNGLSTAVGSFGGGWSSSLSQVDAGLEVAGTTATYRGPNGFRARFTKSGSTWTAAAGFNANLTEDAASTQKRWTLTYHQSGDRVTFAAGGYLTSHVDRNGVGTTYQYDANGHVTRVASVTGRSFDVEWAGPTSSTITAVTDSAGRRTAYGRDGNGNLTTVTRPDTTVESYTYDSTGRLATVEVAGPDGAASRQRVTFGYDSSHRVVSITQAKASTPTTALAKRTFAYSSGTTTVTDGRGNTATFTLDSQGRVLSAKDALGRTRSQTWTSNSDVATTTDALGAGSTPGNVTTYSYDQLNNATGISYPTGAAASATYAQGTSCPGAGSGNPYQPKCTKDDAGNGKQLEYDAAGNLTKVVDSTAGGTAAAEERTYENASRSVCGGFAGQVCSTKNALGGVTRYAYDGSGNLVSVTPPAPAGATVYTHDALGRVTTARDGNNQTVAYRYNVRDDVVEATYPGAASVTTQFNEMGLVSKVLDLAGGAKDLTYDTLGRLTKQVGPNGADQSYAYDLAGNVTSYADANGTTTYAWDAANQLTQVTEPGGTCGSGTPAASSGCVKLGYDANGKETSRTFPGGAKVATVYDLSGRATTIRATDSGGAVVAEVGYAYTVTGGSGPTADRVAVQRRTSAKEVGVTAGAVTSYAYDSLRRLTSATERSGTTTTASWTYAYDKAGNRTSQTRVGSTGRPAGTTTTQYDVTHRITASSADTSTWAYDGVGNQTRDGVTGRSATYDSRQAVTAIGATGYDAFDQGNAETLARTNPAASWTTAAVGLVEHSVGSTSYAFTRDTRGTVVSARQGTARLYYVRDATDSVIGVFDAAGAFTGGYSYSPYGELRSATSNPTITANPLRYTSGLWDEAVGLYRLGARYYDPTLGRFTQADPTGQESNPYLYAGGNPVTRTDPTGALSWASGLKYAAYGLTAAGLFATGVGAPLAVGLGLGAAATAADVGSNLASGNRRGAILAGVFGVLGARTGVAGHLLGASRGASFGYEFAYAGLATWTGEMA